MQNRYVGDVGDFGKYGLLRWLLGPVPGEPQLSLGVVWYLVPDESHTQDGKHIQYLSRTQHNERRFRACDPDLWEQLHGIVHVARCRCVGCVQKQQVLPEGTVFFDDLLDVTGQDAMARRQARTQWVVNAERAVADCDLVFLDPDNGLAGSTVTPTGTRGGKHVLPDELMRFWQGGARTVVLYQQFGRADTHESQRHHAAARIRQALGIEETLLMLHYYRGTGRAFIIIPAAPHRKLLKYRAAAMRDTLWFQERHFTNHEL